MRQRTELAVAVGAALLLAVAAGAIGRARERATPREDRRSVQLAGPLGARAWRDALERLGVEVRLLRRRPAAWHEEPWAERETLIAVLDPSRPLDARDGREVGALLDEGATVLLAGAGAASALACVGYAAVPADTFAATRAGDIARPTLRAAAELRELTVPEPDSGATSDFVAECERRAVAGVTPWLVGSQGQLLGVEVETDAGGTAILLADGGLLANEVLRDSLSAAGPELLALVAGRFERVYVDEYHHGFGPGGALGPALRRWLATTPAGWLLVQLAAVGLLALATGAVRFGPVLPLRRTPRRSPLEHVAALARALSAARGHDVAVRLFAQGLRRRLGRRLDAPRADPAPWLDELARGARAPAARAAAATLRTALTTPTDAAGVQRAANAVEDLWETLTPGR